jgi:hypothetical protein
MNARVTIALAAIGLAAMARVAASPQQTDKPPGSDYPIRPVPLSAVRFTDDFWRPRLEINRTVTIPHILRRNEITGRVDNFLKAARRKDGPYQGQRYNDTDVYKVIEAASFSLVNHPDAALDGKLDELVAAIAAAQEPDGYLYTPRTVDPKNPAPGAGPERWSWLFTSHELYDQGHMYEAAVAHFQATGKRTFLNVAIKSADLVCRTFGPGTRHDVPGHEEIELALVKLFHATGTRTYLDTAKFFLDERGRQHSTPIPAFEPGSRFAIYNDLAYRQDHQPVADQTRAVGHAVRAMYLYAGMTDVGQLAGEPALTAATSHLWTDVVSKRMYVTGGLGSEGRTEAFGDDYGLPNRAYAETCASVGGLLWYHRMFLRDGNAAYYDTFERTLYNGYLSGVSLAGDSFFYQNPLVSDGTRERSAYFDVACCPANLARLMAQLPGLVYAQRLREIFVNLFVGSEADVTVDGTKIRLTQHTDYPWDGRIAVRVDPEKPTRFDLMIRVPGWARGLAMPEGELYRFADAPAGDRRQALTLTVNGQQVPIRIDGDRGAARLSREWRRGDEVVLDLAMPVRRVVARDEVAEDRGAAAIQRGPIVYCLEAVDNKGAVSNLRIPLDAALAYRFDRGLLGGVGVVSADSIVAVPYYAWGNRGKGEMAVWIPYR